MNRKIPIFASFVGKKEVSSHLFLYELPKNGKQAAGVLKEMVKYGKINIVKDGKTKGGPYG